MTNQCVDFRVGTRTLVSRRLSVIQLLGSAPMLSDDPGLMRYLMNHLLEYFPGAQAIVMQALPQALYDGYCERHGLASYVLHGWRDCHTIPLPPSFEEYLQKYSAKKRYNLSRQVRLLAKEAGPVSVLRIDRPDQVAQLFEAITNVVPRRDYEHLAPPAKFERLAANGLLLSYVIKAGDEAVGAVVATQSCATWLVHNIFSTHKYQHLSAGTSTMHLALEDLITNFSFTDVDFGYGTPSSEFRSTHVLKKRGHVLLYRPVGLTAALLAVHRVYDQAHEALAKHLKQARKKFNERRGARQKRAPAPK
ncbi:MAG: GNAT family N-acetyltransferase [Massilia sp.]